MNPGAQNAAPPYLPPNATPPRGAGQAWAWGLGSLALIAGSLVLYFFEPSRWSFYPVCTFHQTTGLLCPGCGTLRSMHHLLHGHWWAAFHCNPLVVTALPLAAAWALRRTVRRWRGIPSTAPLRPGWVWLGFVVLLIFSVLRNLPLPQLAWMSP